MQQPVTARTSSAAPLNFGYKKRECQRIEQENHALAKRLLRTEPEFDRKVLENDFQKHLVYKKQILKVKTGRYFSSPQSRGTKLAPLTSMGSTYYSNKESGTFARGDQNDGAKTARDRKENDQFKKKNKDQEDESDDEFLDEMAGVGLGGKDDSHAKDKSQEKKKTKSPTKGTGEKTPEKKNQGEEIKKVGAKNDNGKDDKKEDDDSEDDFLDEMAGVGLGGMKDSNKRTNRRERNTEAKAETNNIVGTIESRENN